MAIFIGRRRFCGSRYFGDGSYPHQSPNIVLVDTVTGTMYRLTAPGGTITLVAITALASTDIKTDICSIRSASLPSPYYQLTISNGVQVFTPTNDHSRPIYYTDVGNVVREFLVIKNPNLGLFTQVRSEIKL